MCVYVCMCVCVSVYLCVCVSVASQLGDAHAQTHVCALSPERIVVSQSDMIVLLYCGNSPGPSTEVSTLIKLLLHCVGQG